MNYLKGPNIPWVSTFGYSGDYNVLIMQLLDKSLEDLFHKRKKFSLKTTMMLGYQMINVLQYIHDRHIIHRDVKPDNFVMGFCELNANLYLVDFGLSKKFRSSKTLNQYPLTKKKRLTGTARYASIHALEGYEQSRRDDLESVCYTMMYFLRPGLPWMNIKVKNKDEKYRIILERKKSISTQELCKGFPKELVEFIDYIKKLGYTDDPNYDLLRNKLTTILYNKKLKMDYIYDWTTKNDIKNRQNINKKGKSISSERMATAMSSYFCEGSVELKKKQRSLYYPDKKKSEDKLNTFIENTYKFSS